MNYFIAAFLVASLLFCPLTAPAADYAAQTGFTYQSWSSDEDESGAQFYLPVKVQSEYERLSWHVTAGYASTVGELQDGSERTVDGLLDTQLGAAYLLPGGGVDWLFGLDLNVPTGQTELDEADLRIMIDPDRLSIVSPGQGLNINPTVSAARQWGRWAAGLGAGYAFQGEYDYSEQTRDYDPGDIFKVAGQVDYAATSRWALNMHAQYLTVTADQVDGEDYLKKGDTWLVGATVTRTTDEWELEASLQAVFKTKAQIRDSSGDLATESRVSQGDEWLLDLRGRYNWRPQTRFEGAFQYLYMVDNGYRTTSPYYMGERIKYALSFSWLQQLNESLDLQCTLGGFTMDDEPSWLHPGEDRQYQGWSLSAAVTQHF